MSRVDVGVKPPSRERSYLGDGVYASFDGYHIVLETINGMSVTNRILLEPGVYASLTLYMEKLGKE